MSHVAEGCQLLLAAASCCCCCMHHDHSSTLDLLGLILLSLASGHSNARDRATDSSDKYKSIATTSASSSASAPPLGSRPLARCLCTRTLRWAQICRCRPLQPLQPAGISKLARRKGTITTTILLFVDGMMRTAKVCGGHDHTSCRRELMIWMITKVAWHAWPHAGLHLARPHLCTPL
jgi:hypothetical protein